MTRALESSVEGLVSDLGYPWYRAMLAEEGMRTVEDVLVKVGLRRRAASAAEDSGSSLSELDEPVSDADKGMFVEAYLVALGFSETHASEIAEEIVAVHDAHGSATRLRRGHSSADRMFAFDTLDDAGEDAVAEDALDEMKAFAEAFAASASPDNNALPAILQSPAPSDGPTSAEKRAVRAAAAMSKAKAAERGVTRTEPPLHRQPSDEAPLPHSPASTSYAQTQETVRARSGGGFYDPAFLRAVAPLYDLHMGAENLGPLLYSLVRFLKPARVLEVGAGYTSVFILQALRDNAAELEAYRELRAAGMCRCGPAPWSVDAFFDRSAGDGGGRYRGEDVVRHGSARDGLRLGVDDAASFGDGGDVDGTTGHFERRSNGNETTYGSLASSLGGVSGSSRRVSADADGPTSSLASPPPLLARFSEHVPRPGSEDARVAGGTLHCVDNMAHEATTADKVQEVADRLGMSDRLRLHVADAYDEDLPATLAPGVEFDMLWIDLGAANRIERFLENWWPRIRCEGGFALVHSTLTNALSRGWLERMREASRREPTPPYGAFDTMSLLEPHKMFQNAVTMFQKRGGVSGRYDEPVHTKYP